MKKTSPSAWACLVKPAWKK